jgi:ribosomal protein S17E
MGRTKTLLVKRVTHKLMSIHGDEFKDNFEENKPIVDKFVSVPSKKIRNTIVGYITRLVKKSRNSR